MYNAHTLTQHNEIQIYLKGYLKAHPLRQQLGKKGNQSHPTLLETMGDNELMTKRIAPLDSRT